MDANKPTDSAAKNRVKFRVSIVQMSQLGVWSYCCSPALVHCHVLFQTVEIRVAIKRRHLVDGILHVHEEKKLKHPFLDSFRSHRSQNRQTCEDRLCENPGYPLTCFTFVGSN